MEPKHNSKNTRKAQALRKNATPQERHLWYDFLSQYPIRFRRQVTIDRYIVDFYCAAARLVIEVDGWQHYEEQGMDYDAQRTEVLKGLGLEVMRFSNREINCEFDAVCEAIDDAIQKRVAAQDGENERTLD